TVTGTLTVDPNVSGTINGELRINGGTVAVGSGASVTVVGSQGAWILMDGTAPTLTVNGANGVILDNTGGSGVFAAIVVDATPGAGADAFITGSGSIRSDNGNNTVEINASHLSADVQLKLDGATLHGAVTIKDGGGLGNALFDNQGVVK